MDQRNINKSQKEALLTGAGAYAAALDFFLHYGHLKTLGVPAKDLLLQTLEHLASHPFSIFPNDWSIVGQGAFVSAILPLIVYNNFLQKKDLRPSEEHGTAKWCTNTKAFNKKYAGTVRYGAKSENSIIAKDVFLSMDGHKIRRNSNILVVGGSGTGKSQCNAFNNIIQSNASLVVTDPSGELLMETGNYLKSQGYKIKVFNITDLTHSDYFNPFEYLYSDKDTLLMVKCLIKNTTPENSRSSDPFWENAESALITAACFYVHETVELSRQHFGTVLDLIRLGIAEEGKSSTYDRLMEEYRKKAPDSLAVKYYDVFRAAGGGKTAQSVLISVLSRLQTFFQPEVINMTARDTMELNKMGDEKIALFCIMPTAGSPFGYLLSMLLTQTFDTLYRRGESQEDSVRLKVPVRFIFDEFANIGSIPDFDQRLATMRKYNISCTVILQSLDQLKKRYEKEWGSIVGNCDSILFLGTNDKTTLEYISGILGKTTIRSMNTSRSYGRQGSHSVSYNRIARELMTPDELRMLKNNDCIYIMRGENPIYAQKFWWSSHPHHDACVACGHYNVKKEKIITPAPSSTGKDMP